MKTCPVCNQTYPDDSLNFCLRDGTVLTVTSAASDPPPTVVMDNPRRTNPNFGEYESSFGDPSRQIYQPPPAASVVQKQDQTLPIISLILGVFGIILICCYAGFPLGAAAIVTGYLGLNNANKDPIQYGGRSMALGGIVLGAVGILITLAWIFVILISSAVQ